jgi:hypothetical protein
VSLAFLSVWDFAVESFKEPIVRECFQHRHEDRRGDPL